MFELNWHLIPKDSDKLDRVGQKNRMGHAAACGCSL